MISVEQYINVSSSYLTQSKTSIIYRRSKIRSLKLINKGVNLITISSQGWNLNFSIELILILYLI